MRKLGTLLATLLVSLGLFSGVALAATTSCSISNTGSGSINIADCKSDQTFTITCTNNTVVNINNKQTSNSGSSVTVNNTNGSYTTSTGDAVNVNSNDVASNVSCAPVIQASAPSPSPSTTKTTTPSSPTPAAVAPQKAAVLPNTGSDSLVADSAIAIGTLALAAVVTRFGLVAYRQFNLK